MRKGSKPFYRRGAGGSVGVTAQLCELRWNGSSSDVGAEGGARRHHRDLARGGRDGSTDSASLGGAQAAHPQNPSSVPPGGCWLSRFLAWPQAVVSFNWVVSAVQTASCPPSLAVPWSRQRGGSIQGGAAGAVVPHRPPAPASTRLHCRGAGFLPPAPRAPASLLQKHEEPWFLAPLEHLPLSRPPPRALPTDCSWFLSLGF